jgi:hypothetical protein
MPTSRQAKPALFYPEQTPTKLCAACKKLDVSFLAEIAWPPSSHELGSFISIRASASAGCEFCCLLSDAVIAEYSWRKKCTSVEAEARLASSKHHSEQAFLIKARHFDSPYSEGHQLNELIFLVPLDGQYIELVDVVFTISALPGKNHD